MKVVPYSDLRKNLAHILDSVIDDHSLLLITMQNNQTVVL
ncbi:type II toxin-antitoxin system Phd/YefM family antitoxin, partial [Acinetobacter sp. 85]